MPAGSFVKILARRDEDVEVAWIPKLFRSCEYKNGVFAGWVRRRDMSREYPAAGTNRRYDSVQPVEPAPFFDRPEGREIGRSHRNDNLWVMRRRDDGWILVTTHVASFSPKTEDWVQPRGWVPIASLDSIGLADPRGDIASGISSVFRRLGNSPDGGEMVESLGKRFSSRKLCNSDNFDPATFLTSIPGVPFVFYCGPEFGPESALVTAISADGTARSRKVPRNSPDEVVVDLVRKLLAKSAEAPPNKASQRTAP
jgi:hypothetical protein